MPPAVALPFAFAVQAAPLQVPRAALLGALALGTTLAITAAAWQARRGLQPFSAAVAGFAAGLVLAVPIAGLWGEVLAGVCAGLLSLACGVAAARFHEPPPLDPRLGPPP